MCSTHTDAQRDTVFLRDASHPTQLQEIRVGSGLRKVPTESLQFIPMGGRHVRGEKDILGNVGKRELDAMGCGEQYGHRHGSKMMKFRLESGDFCGKKWRGFHDLWDTEVREKEVGGSLG